jgi:ankyrin repeat protein
MPLTPIFAAAYNQCKGINWDNLTELDIKSKSQDGNTLLHYAAYYGCFEKIPKDLRNKKYWTETHNKTTVLMSAFERGKIPWVNPNDLTEEEIIKENGNKDSILTHAIFSKNLAVIPKTSLTKKVLMHPLYSREPAIHAIIRTNQIGELPPSCLNKEILSHKNENGDTGYHKIAQNHHDKATLQNLIAIGLWDQETLTLKASDHSTPLHILASKNAHMIPKKYLTKENLNLKDHRNQSVWHYWTGGSSWMSLPIELATEKDLLEKDNENGKTPLWYLTTKFVDLPGFNDNPTAKEEKKLMAKAIKKLSTKGLQIVKSYKIPAINKIVSQETIKRKICKICKEDNNERKLHINF